MGGGVAQHSVTTCTPWRNPFSHGARHDRRAERGGGDVCAAAEGQGVGRDPQPRCECPIAFDKTVKARYKTVKARYKTVKARYKTVKAHIRQSKPERGGGDVRAAAERQGAGRDLKPRCEMPYPLSSEDGTYETVKARL